MSTASTKKPAARHAASGAVIQQRPVTRATPLRLPTSMFSTLRDVLVAALAVAVMAAVMGLAPSTVHAQQFGGGMGGGMGGMPSSTPRESRRSTPTVQAPVIVRWEPGASSEVWTATGVTVGLGIASLAAGAIFTSLALTDRSEALEVTTTQARAYELMHRSDDFILVSEIAWIAGGILTGIGLTWSLILPSASHAVVVDAPTAPRTSAELHVRFAPGGITLGGTF